MRLQTSCLLLSISVIAINAIKDPACVKKLEGDNYEIVLNSSKRDKDQLTWKCNDTVIYERKWGKINIALYNVTQRDSISLVNLTSLMSCTYTASHLDEKGTLLGSIKVALCVFPRAPVPKLKVECSTGGQASLHCEPKNSTGFRLTWIQNNRDLPKETRNPYQVDQFGEKDRYKCRLSSDHDQHESHEVQISCKASAKVPVPKLTVKCSLEGEATLDCDTNNTTGVTLSWIQNDKDLQKETANPLKIKQFQDKDRYRCRLRRGDEKQDSNEVTIPCKASAKVPVPKLVVQCLSDGAARLHCGPDRKGFKLLWFLNNKEIRNENLNSYQTNQFRETDRYKCQLSNNKDKQDSNEVTISCRPSVPVPKLTLECSSEGEGSLYCGPKNHTGLRLTWILNNKEIRNEVRNPLPTSQLGERSSYRCRLSNGSGKQDSFEVTASCRAPGLGSSADNLFCINKWVMLAILAGGAFLLVVLILSLALVCCKKCQRQKRKFGKEELRLYSLRDTSKNSLLRHPVAASATAATDPGCTQAQKKEPAPFSGPNSDSISGSAPASFPTSHCSTTPISSLTEANNEPLPTCLAKKDPNTPVPQPRKKMNLIPKSQDAANS